ncbi:HPr family phosphocarrier protein [Sulfobacillus thermosulfidooxidans]|uniref:HPr family phosphocarrier protein n=1 Tax=Sulfobacillus thermosulfidooxidans TaxID=28034 RepID=UPI0006B61A43|nr:HPr family phosphocarrier protein [Sulfobacillus thermosulfidooxidans]
MVQRQYTIMASDGLHARVAAQLVKTLATFPFTVQISCHGKTVNGKSILHILSLGAQHHDVVTIDYETDDLTQVTACEQSLSEVIEAISKL